MHQRLAHEIARSQIRKDLHPQPDPEQSALRVRLAMPPFRSACRAEEHGVGFFAFLEHCFGNGVFVFVEGATATQVEVALELGSGGFLDDVEDLEGFVDDLGSDVVAREDQELATLSL